MVQHNPTTDAAEAQAATGFPCAAGFAESVAPIHRALTPSELLDVRAALSTRARSDAFVFDPAAQTPLPLPQLATVAIALAIDSEIGAAINVPSHQWNGLFFEYVNTLSITAPGRLR